MKRLIDNYSNAKRFLSECNRVVFLNKYRGAALQQCRRTRRELVNAIYRMEGGL